MASPQHADKRRRILLAAFEVFGELGYRKTTIQSIATKVGVTPGSLYNYFVDKDDLFLASLSCVWDQFGEAIQVAADNQQIPFVRRAQELFGRAESLLLSAHSLITGSFSSPERRRRLELDIGRIATQLVPFLEEGRVQGLAMMPVEPDRAAFLLRLLIGGALWNLALVEGSALTRELARLRLAFETELDAVQA